MSECFGVNNDLNLICPECGIEIIEHAKDINDDVTCPRCFKVTKVNIKQLRDIIRVKEEKQREEESKREFEFKAPKWCKLKSKN
jgi:hypothetical protein